MFPELQSMIIGTVLGLLVGLALRRVADRHTINTLRWQLDRAQEAETAACIRRSIAEQHYNELVALPPVTWRPVRVATPLSRDVLAQIDADSRN